MKLFPTFKQPIVKNPSVDSSLRSETRIRFFREVSVVLIPTREEFAPVSSKIWYTKDDMSQFKADSGQEMKRYIEGEGKNFTLDNLQEAQMALYGPDALFLLDYIESLERPPQMTRGAFVFDEKDTSPGASPRQ